MSRRSRATCMVVVPDLPGSGDSASPQPPFSAESIAAMLLQGLDQIIGAQAHFSIGVFRWAD